MPKPYGYSAVFAAALASTAALSMSACGDDALGPVESGDSGVDAATFDTASDAENFADSGTADADVAPGDTAELDAADAAVSDLGTNADAEGSAAEPVDPGRVTLRRLNRLEYNNTVRDIFGTSQRPADDFPEDDLGYGFDNNGDVLSTSPLHAEFYLAAAEALVAEALAIPDTRVLEQTLEAEIIGSSVGAASGAAWNLWSNGEVATVVDFPRSGTYSIRVDAFGSSAAGVAANLELTLDFVVLASPSVEGTPAEPVATEVEVFVEAGRHQVSAAFTNDYYDADAGEDRNLFIDRFVIEGPAEAPTSNPVRERFVFCEPAVDGSGECVASILDSFASLAWRRPATTDEVERLRALVMLALEEGDDVNVGLELAFEAALVSPHFIFRPELSADPTALTAVFVDDFALASRLSYFIWASMPDAELMALAERGELNNNAEIDAQVRRMLTDPRAWGFVEGFAAQWLPIRALSTTSPDYTFFPNFDETLRASMRREMELFVWHIVLEDRPIREFLDADYAFVDEHLASLYSMNVATLAAVNGGSPALDGQTGWYRVPVGSHRSGVLGQAGLLTALSHPTRTSPVRRGKWIMTNLLCQSPAPPPPGVESLDGNEALDGLPVRQRMEIHRENPTCYSCHVVMDPLGFGLEHFDAVGAWRDEDSGAPVDASGDLPDGRSFYGATELADVLADDPEYIDCFTRLATTWAIGRGPTRDDRPIRDAIVAEFEASPGRLSDLLSLIAQSPAFRMRRGEAEE